MTNRDFAVSTKRFQHQPRPWWDGMAREVGPHRRSLLRAATYDRTISAWARSAGTGTRPLFPDTLSYGARTCSRYLRGLEQMFFLWVKNNLLLELVTEVQPPWDALRSVHSRIVQWAVYLPAEAPRVNELVFCMFSHVFA